MSGSHSRYGVHLVLAIAMLVASATSSIPTTAQDPTTPDAPDAVSIGHVVGVGKGSTQIRRAAQDEDASAEPLRVGDGIGGQDVVLTPAGGWAVLAFRQEGMDGFVVVGANREFNVARYVRSMQEEDPEASIRELTTATATDIGQGCELIQRTLALDPADIANVATAEPDPSKATAPIVLAPRGLVHAARPTIAWLPARQVDGAGASIAGYQITLRADDPTAFAAATVTVSSGTTSAAWPEAAADLPAGVTVTVEVAAMAESGDDGELYLIAGLGTLTHVFAPFSPQARADQRAKIEALTALDGSGDGDSDGPDRAIAARWFMLACVSLAARAWGEALIYLGCHLEQSPTDSHLRDFARRLGSNRLRMPASATDALLARAHAMAGE